jgi:integrase/recombinase XerD
MSAKTERLFRRYEEHLHLGYGERTVVEYLARARAFLNWLTKAGIELVEVRTSDLQTYQNGLLARRKKDGKAFSLGFQRNHLTSLKNLFGYLYSSGCLLHDPSSTMSFPVKERKLPRVILSPKEVRLLLGKARKRTPTGLRDRALLETLYGTGIRASELANLMLNDVDTEEKILTVRLGKGRKDRSVPLTSAAAEAIEAYLQHGRPRLDVHPSSLLFLADKGGRLHPFYRASSLPTPRKPASKSASPAIPSATAWPPIFSRAEPTSVTSRNSSVTNPSRPPSATPGSRSRT